MKVIEFIKFLSKSGYTVNECPKSKDYIIFSGRVYLGAFEPDKDNVIFWFNDNCVLPARDFMLDGLDTSEICIRYPYKYIFVIKGFKYVKSN